MIRRVLWMNKLDFYVLVFYVCLVVGGLVLISIYLGYDRLVRLIP